MKKTAGYIVLSLDRDGSIIGYTEHSISMGFSKEVVRVHRPFEYRYAAQKHYSTKRQQAYQHCVEMAEKLNKRHKKEGTTFRAFRVGSKNCPVSISWKRVAEMHRVKKIKKFEWRNLPFHVRKDVEFHKSLIPQRR